jgi:hypothetical protein
VNSLSQVLSGLRDEHGKSEQSQLLEVGLHIVTLLGSAHEAKNQT